MPLADDVFYDQRGLHRNNTNWMLQHDGNIETIADKTTWAMQGNARSDFLVESHDVNAVARSTGRDVVLGRSLECGGWWRCFLKKGGDVWMRAPTKIPDFHMTHVQNHIEMAILLLPFLGIRSVALPKRKLTVRGRPLFPAKNESTTAHTEHKRQAQRPRTSNNPKAEGRSPQASTSQLAHKAQAQAPTSQRML
jgi:hypothetical protein